MSTLTVQQVLERGVVYADKWPSQIRDALNVSDPLTEIVADSLNERQSVIITGNAGDGKSHLAQQVIAGITSRLVDAVDVLSGGNITPDDVVFIRDASALRDEQILAVVERVKVGGSALLMTVNEGPLATLAANPRDTGLFESARDILHGRSEGRLLNDVPNLRVVNLAGRQLTESTFAADVLNLTLKYVTPCATCGPKNKTCPRVVGAAMLRKSTFAKRRMAELLRLLTSAGTHLTARDIWAFYIDLFFGWVCAPNSELQIEGFFWMRLFEASDSPLQQRLAHEFDPVKSPSPNVDAAAWLGDFRTAGLPVEYPGTVPAVEYRESERAGMTSFASAKRAYFLFAREVDIRETAARTSMAPVYRQLLESAIEDPRVALRQIVRLLNEYRMATSSETELWVSRHHGMAAHRRPAALAASVRLPIGALELRIPYTWDMSNLPGAGYFPDRLLLKWEARQPVFAVDYGTWQQLRERRSLAVDRDQELLDYAIDLFMAQAPVEAEIDPEIRIRDHRDGRTYQVRARHEERGLEVLS